MTTCRPLDYRMGQLVFILLCGYALLGKGFAYLNVPLSVPLYVGELVLACGAGYLVLVSPSLGLMRGKTVLLAYVLFLSWGVARTVPHVRQFGVDSIRDSAVYYYGLYMILAYALARRKGMLDPAVLAYSRFSSVVVVWSLVAFYLFYFQHDLIPETPLSPDVKILQYKGGDYAVQITAAMAFWLLMAPGGAREIGGVSRYLWYSAGVAGVLLTISRGAYLSFAAGMATVYWFQGMKRIKYYVVVPFILVVLAAIASGKSIDLQGKRGEVSVDRFLGLVNSIYSSDNDDVSVRQGTKEWRLRWWKMIVDETVFGPYFWTGRGFGPNLAAEHGFLGGSWEKPLRSPHNSHMTILSRMGVPGALVWVFMHFALVYRFYTRWKIARTAGEGRLAGLLAWVVVFWVAFVVNSTFDVYFEGPQGAIWFWSVMGFGLAVADMVDEKRAGADVPEVSAP